MADSIDVLFREEPPRREIEPFLSRQKLSYFARTDNSTTLGEISSFYREIDQGIRIVEEKFMELRRN